MRVIALRHGESEFNLLGLCNDDPARRVDLTDAGRRQAATAARELVGQGVERVFCSPLTRASDTAAIVADILGLEVEPDPRLADIRSGCDGQPVSDYLAAIAADPVDTRVGDGESLRDYQQRVSGFLQYLAAQPGQCVLLVAHEETLRLIDAHFNRLPLHAVVGRAFANCRPYVFQSDSEN